MDGRWVIDPLADGQVKYHEDDIQSIMVIEPNYKFRLKNYQNAHTVIVIGSFNNWNEKAFVMKKDERGWFVDLHIPVGKHLYKFIVDGNWIVDPASSNNEKNERGSYNSVMFMQPQP